MGRGEVQYGNRGCHVQPEPQLFLGLVVDCFQDFEPYYFDNVVEFRGEAHFIDQPPGLPLQDELEGLEKQQFGVVADEFFEFLVGPSLLLQQELGVGELAGLETARGVGGEVQSSGDDTGGKAVHVIVVVIELHITVHDMAVLAGSSPIDDTPEPRGTIVCTADGASYKRGHPGGVVCGRVVYVDFIYLFIYLFIYFYITNIFFFLNFEF